MIPSLSCGNASLSVGCLGSCVDFYISGGQISGDQKSPHVCIFYFIFFLEEEAVVQHFNES